MPATASRAFVRAGAPALRTTPYTAADVAHTGKLELHFLVDHLPVDTTPLGVVRAVRAQLLGTEDRIAHLWSNVSARRALYRAALARHADNAGLPAAVRQWRSA